LGFLLFGGEWISQIIQIDSFNSFYKDGIKL